jgi:hypothetical protein
MVMVFTPLRKVPITATAPQPGDHVTVRTGGHGDHTWRHGIVMGDGTVTDGRTRHSWSAFGDSEYMVYVVAYSGGDDDDARRATACRRATWFLQKHQKHFCTWFQNDKEFAMWCSTPWTSGDTGSHSASTSNKIDIDAMPLPRAEFYTQKAASILDTVAAILGSGQHA